MPPPHVDCYYCTALPCAALFQFLPVLQLISEWLWPDLTPLFPVPVSLPVSLPLPVPLVLYSIAIIRTRGRCPSWMCAPTTCRGGASTASWGVSALDGGSSLSSTSGATAISAVEMSRTGRGNCERAVYDAT